MIPFALGVCIKKSSTMNCTRSHTLYIARTYSTLAGPLSLAITTWKTWTVIYKTITIIYIYGCIKGVGDDGQNAKSIKILWLEIFSLVSNKLLKLKLCVLYDINVYIVIFSNNSKNFYIWSTPFAQEMVI